MAHRTRYFVEELSILKLFALFNFNVLIICIITVFRVMTYNFDHVTLGVLLFYRDVVI